MWRHRVAYIALWMFTFLLYVLYIGYVSWYLWILVSALPILSFLYAWVAKIHVYIQLDVKQQRYIRYEKGSIYIKSNTSTYLPIGKIQGVLTVQNLLTQEIKREVIAFGSAKILHKYEIIQSFEACGKYVYTLSDLYAYDALGIFRFRIKQKSNTCLYCLPTPQVCELPLPSIEQETDMEFDSHKKGNDRSEVFGIHEYQPGDSLHAIHWKLSAKMDTLMVRDFAYPRPKLTSLCFELYGNTMDVQAILTNVYGCGLFLLSNHRTHEIVQYGQSQVLMKRQIQTKEDLDACMCMIFDQTHEISNTSSLPMNAGKNIYVITQDGMKKEDEDHA